MVNPVTRLPIENGVYAKRHNKIKILGLIKEEKLVLSIGMGSSNEGISQVLLLLTREKKYVNGMLN